MGESVAAAGPMDVQTALQEVLKQALINDGLARGLHEAAKALDKLANLFELVFRFYHDLFFRRTAHMCVLAENCDEPMYAKLVEALCTAHQIPLIKVNTNEKQ